MSQPSPCGGQGSTLDGTAHRLALCPTQLMWQFPSTLFPLFFQLWCGLTEQCSGLFMWGLSQSACTIFHGASPRVVGGAEIWAEQGLCLSSAEGLAGRSSSRTVCVPSSHSGSHAHDRVGPRKALCVGAQIPPAPSPCCRVLAYPQDTLISPVSFSFCWESEPPLP